MEPKLETTYKDIVKDEKSLIKYLNDLVLREDIDTKNKIFSACLAGRMYEFEHLILGNKEKVFEVFMESLKEEKKER